jgi:hypothetical protein
MNIETEIEAEDAEVAYLRGFQQGAYEAIRAIETTPIAKVKKWADETLANWRYRDRVHDRGLRPPRP